MWQTVEPRMRPLHRQGARGFGRYIRDYLNSTYKNWDEKKLVYDKYSWVGRSDED
nr:MAG TPA: hypothetical protein [Caudoviricetes sp.]